MLSQVIGAPQIILLLIVPIVVVFLVGFWLGKKSGYIKRVKEEKTKY